MENIRLDDHATSSIGEDRISQLPDSVINRILFFLPAKDAARTSILSKAWLHEWNSLPIFSFRSNVLRQNLLNPMVFPVLMLTSIWIMSISLWKSSMITRPGLPLATFASNSFSVLELKACALTPEVLGDNHKLPCLRELSLSQVILDDQMVQSLLANCPSLETFILESGAGAVENVSLRHLPKLRKVWIAGVRVVVIEAINIQKLHCRFREPHISLEGLKISSQKLRHLTLCTMPRVGPMEVDVDAPNLRSYNSHIIGAEVAPFSVSFNTLRPIEAKLNVWGIDNLSAQSFIGLQNYLPLFKFNVLKIYVYSDVVCETLILIYNELQFSLDKLISREEDPQCCSNCRTKCWWHHLKAMKMGKIVGIGYEDGENCWNE
ncbi:hypothetical protein DITRI_Ditri19aG0095900 [Diplodiscus trichospermus]